MNVFFIRNFSNVIENIKDWIKRYKVFLIFQLTCFLIMAILAISMVVKNTNCLTLERLTNNDLYCYLIQKSSFFHFYFCLILKFSLFLSLNCLCFCCGYLKYISILISSIFVFKIFYDITLIICILNAIGVVFSLICLLICYLILLMLLIILQLSLCEKLQNQCGDFNFCYDFKFIGFVILCSFVVILIQCILISIFLPILNLFV